MITTTKADGSVETSFVGCVVERKSESVQVMSDMWEYHTYAIVFNNESGTFERHFLFSDYPGYAIAGEDRRDATVDATDQIMALYDCHKAVIQAKRVLAECESQADKALREVRAPGKGKTLKVVKGRKVAIGTVGECIWHGQGRAFSYHSNPWRVGIKLANNQVVYTDEKNVEVIIG